MGEKHKKVWPLPAVQDVAMRGAHSLESIFQSSGVLLLWGLASHTTVQGALHKVLGGLTVGDNSYLSFSFCQSWGIFLEYKKHMYFLALASSSPGGEFFAVLRKFQLREG